MHAEECRKRWCWTRSTSEHMHLTSLNPGSRIAVSYPGEPDRFFEMILGWSVGDATCWVSTCGDCS